MNIFSFLKNSVIALFFVVLFGTLCASSAQAAPAKPTNLNAQCVNGKLTFSWSQVSGVNTYAIRVDDLSNGWGGDSTLPGDVVNNNVFSPFTVFGQVGHEYAWWVHAVDSNGVYSDAAFLSQLTVCAPPAPSALSQTCNNGLLDLSWQNSAGAVKYAIRIDDLSNGWGGDSALPGDVVNNNVSTTFFRHNSENGHVYIWWIHAIDQTGHYSEAALGQGLKCQVPAPTNLQSSCGTNHSVISWNPANGADHYALRVDDLSNGWGGDSALPGDLVTNALFRTSYTIPADAGHTYAWWVHSVDASGGYSDAVGGPVCFGPPPQAPSFLQASCNNGMATFSWAHVNFAAKYTIRIDNGSNPFPAEGDVINDDIFGTQFSIFVQPHTFYNWWVHSVGANGLASEASLGMGISCQ